MINWLIYQTKQSNFILFLIYNICVDFFSCLSMTVDIENDATKLKYMALRGNFKSYIQHGCYQNKKKY